MNDYEIRIDGEKETARKVRIAGQQGFERGYNRRQQVEWAKLFLLTILATFLGCSLAAAFWVWIGSIK